MLLLPAGPCYGPAPAAGEPPPGLWPIRKREKGRGHPAGAAAPGRARGSRVVDGRVISKSAFRGTATQDVSMYVEGRIKRLERATLLLRVEGFNLFNHGNYLGRGQTTYGDTATVNNTFGHRHPEI